MKLIKKLPDPLLNECQKKWDEFCTASKEAKIPLPNNPELIEIIQQVFTFSDFAAKSCIRHPEILYDLIQSNDLQREYRTDEYYHIIQSHIADIKNEAELSPILRKIRCREMVRIAFRDLAGWADLSETMTNLSTFADACIDKTLSCLYDLHCSEYGIPVDADGSQLYLVVLGMGKLGAWELNFSSDIDLIFAYGAGNNEHTLHPATCTLQPESFFTRLCRQLINILGAKTADGILFRVDMTLRPFGESGPLAMNFDAMDEYYHIQGREWERYAWIKARVAAGNKTAGANLLKRLNPFIYRRYLDFGVFESLRDMKYKISLEVKRKGVKGNIKLGAGGIREIEFFGQIFQLIRGGVEAGLQERPIQKVLKILAEDGHIEQDICDELTAAYIFLRNTEHRLQEFADQQTHKLPTDPLEQARLAASMGFEDWDKFISEVILHRKTVHHHFNRLLEAKNPENSDEKQNSKLKMLWQNPADNEYNHKILSALGFYNNSGEVLRLLDSFQKDAAIRNLSKEGWESLDRLIPLVLQTVSTSEHPLLALSRIIDLLKSIQRRITYLSLLLENPSVLTHLVNLANASSWILSFLTRHPVLLDELLDPRTLYLPPKRSELEKELRHRLEQILPDDLEYQMEVLRIFKQVNILRVAAADITNALPLMKVSDHLSDIAETILNEVVHLSWHYLVEKHGEPECYLPCSQTHGCERKDTCDKGFVVIAYGKLGGLELGYNSDLDLVFLHAGTKEQTKGGERPVDNSQFFARLGQRVIHILTPHTSAGILYETDMRLHQAEMPGFWSVILIHLKNMKCRKHGHGRNRL